MYIFHITLTFFGKHLFTAEISGWKKAKSEIMYKGYLWKNSKQSANTLFVLLDLLKQSSG